MRLPKRGEKGFTLIELLIVVAILGVLAAVVIPNVSRFIGAGEEEAAATELSNIQTAVVSLMVDNELSTIPSPVTTPTANMSAFPDATSNWDTVPAGDPGKKFDTEGGTFETGDLPGYVLYGHDMIGGGTSADLVNYVATQLTTKWYTVDEQGTVTQSLTPPTP